MHITCQGLLRLPLIQAKTICYLNLEIEFKNCLKSWVAGSFLSCGVSCLEAGSCKGLREQLMYTSSRIWMGLLAFLCVPVGAYTQPAGQKSAEETLTLRLLQKRDHYPFQVGQTTPGGSAVVLVVELKNTGAKKLDLVGPPEPELQLTGPAAATVIKSGRPTFYVKQEQRFSLNPGETRRLLLRQLSYRIDRSQFHLEWAQPGTYTLKAIYSLGVAAADEAAGDPEKADAARSVRQVTVASAAVKFEVARRTSSPIGARQPRTAMRKCGGRRSSPWRAWAKCPKCRPRSGPVPGGQGPCIPRASNPYPGGIWPGSQGDLYAGALESPQGQRDKRALLRRSRALAAVAAREQETAPALVPLLKDREPQVRMAVADAFRQIPFGGGKIEPATLAALLNALRLEAITEVRGRLIGRCATAPI